MNCRTCTKHQGGRDHCSWNVTYVTNQDLIINHLLRYLGVANPQILIKKKIKKKKTSPEVRNNIHVTEDHWDIATWPNRDHWSLARDPEGRLPVQQNNTMFVNHVVCVFLYGQHKRIPIWYIGILLCILYLLLKI